VCVEGQHLSLVGVGKGTSKLNDFSDCAKVRVMFGCSDSLTTHKSNPRCCYPRCLFSASFKGQPEMQGMPSGPSANTPQRTESNLRHRDNCTAQDDELEFDDGWHVDDDVAESDT